VLCDGTGKPLTQKVIQVLVRRTARRANVKPGIHILRHSFCSHLAMRGAPARAIQELAGHQDLGTTQRYMHLAARLVAAEPPTKTQDDTLLTVEEAAQRLGVSKDWLYRRSRKLPFVVRLSRHVRYSAEGIERFIRSRVGR
jgi:excisionase family DNA binding protein